MKPRMRQPLKTTLAACLATSLLGTGFSAQAADDTKGPYYGTQGKVIDDTVMYSIGGGATNGAPTSLYRPSGIGIGMSWETDLMCGNMDLTTTVRNQLNGATDGFKQLMGDVVNAATGVVASLPAMLIQRANPGLYELLSNGVLQARLDFDQSRVACRAWNDTLNEKYDTGGWEEIAKVQTAKEMLGFGKKDAVQTVKDVEEQGGDDGVPWVDGNKAGGKGQPPIKLTESVVTAGYNALHQRAAADTSKVSAPDCKGGGLCTTWASPKEAADWAKRVLGEKQIQTCKSCEPMKTTAGSGLTPLVAEEYEEKAEQLNELLNPDTPITAEKLNTLSTEMLPISRRLVEALRDDPDQAILSQRLASELAFSEVMGKGLLLQRTLAAGGRNPHVEQTKPANEGVQKDLALLKSELDALKTELDIRKTLSDNTATIILARKEAARSAQGFIQTDDPNRNRLQDMDKPQPDKSQP